MRTLDWRCWGRNGLKARTVLILAATMGSSPYRLVLFFSLFRSANNVTYLNMKFGSCWPRCCLFSFPPQHRSFAVREFSELTLILVRFLSILISSAEWYSLSLELRFVLCMFPFDVASKCNIDLICLIIYAWKLKQNIDVVLAISCMNHWKQEQSENNVSLSVIISDSIE